MTSLKNKTKTCLDVCVPMVSTAYLAALLRLLSEAESVGLVGPGDVEVVEEEEEEEDEDNQGPRGDFQDQALPDYDDTGRGMNMGRPPADFWRLLEPQLAQALLDRLVTCSGVPLQTG